MKGKRAMNLEALKVCQPTDFEDISFRRTDFEGGLSTTTPQLLIYFLSFHAHIFILEHCVN